MYNRCVMKILIVEDNYQLATNMRSALSGQYVVELAPNGEDALFRCVESSFDIVILDLGLPDTNGLKVCESLRASGQTMPILIVTGEDDPGSVVELLDAGADDYLLKPFRVDELKARIRALGRRASDRTPEPRLITAGDITLDRDNRVATRDGITIPLRTKEFILLEQLMLRPNIVLSRATLLDKAWDDSENVWSNYIDVHIKYLRDKIDKPFGSRSIETVHGLGYRINTKKTTK